MKHSRVITEVIFASAIIVVVGIVSMMMLLRANTMQNMAHDLDSAGIIAQTVIEEFKAGAATETGLSYFDRNFNSIHAPDSDGYVLDIAVTNDGGGLYSITVEVRRMKVYFGSDETNILSLSTSVFRGGGK